MDIRYTGGFACHLKPGKVEFARTQFSAFIIRHLLDKTTLKHELVCSPPRRCREESLVFNSAKLFEVQIFSHERESNSKFRTPNVIYMYCSYSQPGTSSCGGDVSGSGNWKNQPRNSFCINIDDGKFKTSRFPIPDIRFVSKTVSLAVGYIHVILLVYQE